MQSYLIYCAVPAVMSLFVGALWPGIKAEDVLIIGVVWFIVCILSIPFALIFKAVSLALAGEVGAAIIILIVVWLVFLR